MITHHPIAFIKLFASLKRILKLADKFPRPCRREVSPTSTELYLMRKKYTFSRRVMSKIFTMLLKKVVEMKANLSLNRLSFTPRNCTLLTIRKQSNIISVPLSEMSAGIHSK
ncbi:hypothetical protein CEXT_740211 [Caerostris extrusa]|uniref:Uncharacterized protein n=1 Tax=Caerostris extrusa TaxID=172846 RepID=A0AAV4RDN5_CAEEX|nr:hypothetical protein CEXT_740211 [Caerostris extrusa]